MNQTFEEKICTCIRMYLSDGNHYANCPVLELYQLQERANDPELLRKGNKMTQQNKCPKAHCRCIQDRPCSNHHYSDCGWVFDKPTHTEPKSTQEGGIEGILEEFEKAVAENYKGQDPYWPNWDGIKAFVVHSYKAGQLNGVVKGLSQNGNITFEPKSEMEKAMYEKGQAAERQRSYLESLKSDISLTLKEEK